jgi:Zn-dependent protease
LFRFAGIDVYLHWSWILLALFGIQNRAAGYSSLVWPALELLSLMVIVALHEIGHLLACRRVGGRADRIVLRPFGGAANVSPPPRAGATLWCAAAGPLVNAALFLMFSVLLTLPQLDAWAGSRPDTYHLLLAVWRLDLVVLFFNLLPVYPLDGGQMLQSLLWFLVGRARSLILTAYIGFVGAGLLVLLAGVAHDGWLRILCALAVVYCWGGLRRARALSGLAAAPRRQGLACPACQDAPRIGAFWRCGKCGGEFDVFDRRGVCPNCGARAEAVPCLSCGTVNSPQAFGSCSNEFAGGPK